MARPLFTISVQLRKSSPEVIELAEFGSTKHTMAPNKAVHKDLMVGGAAKKRLAICDTNKRRQVL